VNLSFGQRGKTFGNRVAGLFCKGSLSPEKILAKDAGAIIVLRIPERNKRG
jgi:hypothetical protein